MEAHDKEIIANLPIFLAQSWKLVVEADDDAGVLRELDMCLEKLLKGLVSYALAEYCLPGATSQALNDELTGIGNKWSLGHYQQILRSLLVELDKRNEDSVFLSEMVDWYVVRSRAKKPPLTASALKLNTLTSARNKAAHGKESDRFDPSLVPTYRNELREVLRDVGDWIGSYPLFTITQKSAMPGGNYKGTVVWYRGTAHEKKRGVLWTADQLNQGQSAIVAKQSPDGTRSVLYMDHLIRVVEERSKHRVYLFQRIDKTGQIFLASDQEEIPLGNALQVVKPKLVSEEQYVDSFAVQARPAPVQYGGLVRRFLSNDGAITSEERMYLQQFGLDRDATASIEAGVLCEVADELAPEGLSASEYPALTALGGTGDVKPERLAKAHAEFSELFQSSPMGRARSEGHARTTNLDDTSGTVDSRGRSWVGLALKFAAITVAAFAWKGFGMPVLRGDTVAEDSSYVLRPSTWAGSVRQLGLPLLSIGFELEIEEVEGNRFAGSIKWYGDSVTTNKIVGSHEGNRLVFTETKVDGGDVEYGATSLGTEKEVLIDELQMVGTDDGGWSNLEAFGTLSAVCGDGLLHSTELCDDGNTWGGDLCSAECTTNVARVEGGSLNKGFSQSELDAGMYAVMPSRRGDDYLRTTAMNSHPMTPVRLGGFWMLKTEVSWGAVRSFVESEGVGRLDVLSMPSESRSWFETNIRNSQLSLASQVAKKADGLSKPAMVLRSEAVAVCAHLGGAIPTEELWEMAARGPNGARVFPWGDEPPLNAPEDCGYMTAYTIFSTDPLVELNCGGREPSSVGSLPKGCTPEGICDMAGNLDEFVMPGAVIWKEIDLEETEGAAHLVATPAGAWPGDTEHAEFLDPCVNLARTDPFGLVSGKVFDCVRFAAGNAPATALHSYPAERALSIVRGGNFNDSLPVFYQNRARYPFLNHESHAGFRCVFFSEPE